MSENAIYYLQAFAPLILIVVFLWLFMLRPQKKRDKQIRDMRNNIAEGDEIVTIGGMIGKVLSVKEDSVVVYVGADKTKMEFKKWAISEVTLKNDKNDKKPAAEAVEEPKKKIRKLSRKEDAEETTAAPSEE